MEEFIYAEKGTGRVRVDGEVARIGPVVTILMAAGTCPMMLNAGHAPPKWGCVFSAAGSKNRYREYPDIRYSE